MGVLGTALVCLVSLNTLLVTASLLELEGIHVLFLIAKAGIVVESPLHSIFGLDYLLYDPSSAGLEVM